MISPHIALSSSAIFLPPCFYRFLIQLQHSRRIFIIFTALNQLGRSRCILCLFQPLIGPDTSPPQLLCLFSALH
jgi:hypothetical protein